MKKISNHQLRRGTVDDYTSFNAYLTAYLAETFISINTQQIRKAEEKHLNITVYKKESNNGIVKWKNISQPKIL